jgi:hypothetical protein
VEYFMQHSVDATSETTPPVEIATLPPRPLRSGLTVLTALAAVGTATALSSYSLTHWGQRLEGVGDLEGFVAHLFRAPEDPNALYAFGTFSSRVVPGTPAQTGIMRWNEGVWSAVRTDLDPTLRMLCSVERDGKTEIFGVIDGVNSRYAKRIAVRPESKLGVFSLRSAWEEIGSVDGTVEAAVSYNGEMYISGSFQNIGGKKLAGLARFRLGDWESAFGEARLTFEGGESTAAVSTVAVFENLLVIGGRFDQIGGLKVPGIAAWNGKQWLALDPGFYSEIGFPGVQGLTPPVISLKAGPGALFALMVEKSSPNQYRSTLLRYAGGQWSHLNTRDASTWISMVEPVGEKLLATAVGETGNDEVLEWSREGGWKSAARWIIPNNTHLVFSILTLPETQGRSSVYFSLQAEPPTRVNTSANIDGFWLPEPPVQRLRIK